MGTIAGPIANARTECGDTGAKASKEGRREGRQAERKEVTHGRKAA